MAYYNSNNYRGNRSKGSWYGKSRNYGSKRKSKYTNAEKIAFRLGQEELVANTINAGLSHKKESRVYDAYCKGRQGMPQGNKQKSLFGD